MSQTDTPLTSTGGSKPPSEPFAPFAKALKDAEESLKRLAVEARTAAERSSAFSGAEKDAQRMAQWLREHTADWTKALQVLEKDADEFATELGRSARRIAGAAAEKSATVKGLADDSKRVAAKIKGAVPPKK